MRVRIEVVRFDTGEARVNVVMSIKTLDYCGCGHWCLGRVTNCCVCNVNGDDRPCLVCAHGFTVTGSRISPRAS